MYPKDSISAEYIDRIVILAEQAIKDKETVDVKVVNSLLMLIGELRTAKSLYFY